MLNIAITGGIGAGKSCVTEYLIEKGYTVIDADKMSREMTSAGGKAMPYILEHFGPEYINEDGSMNRAAMRDLVFNEPKFMKTLEAGTTAVVLADIEAIRKEKEAEGAEVIFYDIPLLFEKHKENDYDQVWVVSADRNLKAERIMKRDHLDPAIIDLMIETQAEDEYKESKADVVLHNNGTIAELRDLIDDTLASLKLS